MRLLIFDERLEWLVAGPPWCDGVETPAPVIYKQSPGKYLTNRHSERSAVECGGGSGKLPTVWSENISGDTRDWLWLQSEMKTPVPTRLWFSPWFHSTFPLLT